MSFAMQQERPFAELMSEPLRNGVYKAKEFHGHGIKIVNMGELFAHDFIGHQEMRRLELSESERQKSLLKAGDLLFARRSLVLEGAGRCSLVTTVAEPTTFESSLIRVRPDQRSANPRYLFYLFRSPLGRAKLASIAARTAVSGIKGSDLAALRLPVPPLGRQARIASILGAYDDLIEVNRRRIAVLEEMARRLFDEWFVHFRFPGCQLDSSGIPKGWRVGRLGDVADLKSGEGKVTKAAYVAEGYTAFSASGPDGFLPTFRCDGKAVVVSGVGAYCGRTWLARGQWTGIANTFYLAPKDGVPAEYIYLATHGIEKWPRRGAAQPFIARSDATAMEMVIPAADALAKFEVLADPLLSSVWVLQRQMERLAGSRDLLLPKLISGEIAVSLAECELEAVA